MFCMSRAAALIILVIVVAAGIGTYYAFKSSDQNGTDISGNATTTDLFGSSTSTDNTAVSTTSSTSTANIGAPRTGGTTSTPAPRTTARPTLAPTVVHPICLPDVRMCPDGSQVRRVAPSCQFAMCPITSNTNSSSNNDDDDGAPSAPYTGGGDVGLVDAWVTLNPTCRVNYPPANSSCAKSLRTILDIRTRDTGDYVTRVSSDANGRFQVSLPGGIYEIYARDGSCTVETIEVKVDTVTSPHVICAR